MQGEASISIVDDDESVREAIKGLMKSLGYTVASFASAEEFLASNGADGSACLIVDMQMPGMSGLALHDHLIASGKSVPTILITAFPDEKTRARALQRGVLSYLAKPFSESELLRCIRSVMEPKPGN